MSSDEPSSLEDLASSLLLLPTGYGIKELQGICGIRVQPMSGGHVSDVHPLCPLCLSVRFQM